jgi:hypothetical protein
MHTAENWIKNLSTFLASNQEHRKFDLEILNIFTTEIVNNVYSCRESKKKMNTLSLESSPVFEKRRTQKPLKGYQFWS